MRVGPILASVLVSVAPLCGQDAAPPATPPAAAESIRGADEQLLKAVRAVAERVAGIVETPPTSGVVAVRADDAVRSVALAAKAAALLPAAVAAARGRAWRDLGFGSGSGPGDLVAAIAADLPGMAFDTSGSRLLVDPQRLPDVIVRGDPDVDPDASIMLATGVAPDETIAGHYIAHALLDGPPLRGPVTTDAVLARSALAEGSANLAGLILLFGGVGLESEVLSGSLRPDQALGGRLVPDTVRSGSPVVASLMEFVYLDGFAQAAAVARKGGFRRLAQERAARLTTRDVLHLDRPRLEAASIPTPEFPAALRLSIADRDSLGEQGIVTLVSLLTGKDNLGLIAGDGWVGDALWRFERAAPASQSADEGATVWVTQWKSDEDAADFVYALERCLQARFPGETLEDDRQRGGRVLRRADRVYRVKATGLSVVMTVATPSIDANFGPLAKKKEAVPPQRQHK